MNIAMSIRHPKDTKVKVGETTEFHLHKSQYTIFTGILHLVADYTEYKLKKCINEAVDKQQKNVLLKLLKDYIAGNVAVAWKRGQPVWVMVSKD